jgi:hypothetical protein
VFSVEDGLFKNSHAKVIGGILSSTFLTLVLPPVLYVWFERERCSPAGGDAAKFERESSFPASPSAQS